MCNPAKHPAAPMRNPYESYIQALLPLLISQAEDESSTPTKVTVSICDDNARSLCDDDSMTMKLLKPKVSAVNRWSSVPDLQGFKMSMLSNKASNSRSIDDLRSLMTNNSRAPRSTDNLRGALSTGSLARVKRQACNGSSTRGNDRWESKAATSKKNPFDLRMPGLGLPTKPITPPRRTTAQQSGMKIPQRRVSMEAVRRDEPGCQSQRDRTSSRVMEDCDSSSEQNSPLLDLAPQPVIRAS